MRARRSMPCRTRVLQKFNEGCSKSVQDSDSQSDAPLTDCQRLISIQRRIRDYEESGKNAERERQQFYNQLRVTKGRFRYRASNSPHSALSCPQLQSHSVDGPKVDHALTLKLDHSTGVGQRNGYLFCEKYRVNSFHCPSKKAQVFIKYHPIVFPSIWMRLAMKSLVQAA